MAGPAICRGVALLIWLSGVIAQRRAVPAPAPRSRHNPVVRCASADPTCGALLVHPTGVPPTCVISPTISQCTNMTVPTGAQTESSPDPLESCPDDDLYTTELSTEEIVTQVVSSMLSA